MCLPEQMDAGLGRRVVNAAAAQAEIDLKVTIHAIQWGA